MKNSRVYDFGLTSFTLEEKVSRIYRTRSILDCDQSNYSLLIILSHIRAKLLSDEKWRG